MTLFAALDPGANTGFALITGPYSVITADNRADIFSLLDGLKDKPCVIGLEKVHALWGKSAASTFTFGSEYGFWVGVLEFLELKYTDVTPKEWQDATIKKPPRPPITGLSSYHARKVKALHTDMIKQESCRAASAAFPKAHLSNHNVCDSVNMARFLRHVYERKNNGKES